MLGQPRTPSHRRKPQVKNPLPDRPSQTTGPSDTAGKNTFAQSVKRDSEIYDDLSGYSLRGGRFLYRGSSPLFRSGKFEVD